MTDQEVFKDENILWPTEQPVIADFGGAMTYEMRAGEPANTGQR